MPTQHTELPVIVQAGKPISYIYRDRTWSNTPNFWAMRDNSALLPINSYDDSRISLFQTLGREIVTRKSDGVVTSDTRIGYATTAALFSRHSELSAWVAGFEPPDASLQNEAAVKALGKLADAKVNLPVAAAEARKTVDMILGKANQVYQFISSVRHGHYKYACSVLGIRFKKGPPILKKKKESRQEYEARLETDWHKYILETKYGWMPLLMDIKGAAEAIVDTLHGGRLPWQQASAMVTATTPKYKRTVDEGYSKGSFYEESASAVKTYKVKILADISMPGLNRAQQLGLTNPALVLWELVPFSFVFDWFVSVGDYLLAATALEGVSVRRAFVSRMREVKTSYYSHAHPAVRTTDITSGYEFKFGSYGRRYTRDPYVVNPLFLYPPVDRDPLKMGRLVAGMALLKGNARNLRV